jgi:hypothetical protein
VNRRLVLLIGLTVAFWGLIALPARAVWGDAAVVCSGVAAILCLIPAAATLLWADWAYRQPIDKQFAMVLGGTGLRLFVVLAGAYALQSSVPYFREHDTPGFLLWVLGFYLFTLALETVLSVSGRPTAEPLPAGPTPPPNA